MAERLSNSLRARTHLRRTQMSAGERSRGASRKETVHFAESESRTSAASRTRHRSVWAPPFSGNANARRSDGWRGEFGFSSGPFADSRGYF